MLPDNFLRLFQAPFRCMVRASGVLNTSTEFSTGSLVATFQKLLGNECLFQVTFDQF